MTAVARRRTSPEVAKASSRVMAAVAWGAGYIKLVRVSLHSACAPHPVVSSSAARYVRREARSPRVMVLLEAETPRSAAMSSGTSEWSARVGDADAASSETLHIAARPSKGARGGDSASRHRRRVTVIHAASGVASRSQSSPPPAAKKSGTRAVTADVSAIRRGDASTCPAWRPLRRRTRPSPPSVTTRDCAARDAEENVADCGGLITAAAAAFSAPNTSRRGRNNSAPGEADTRPNRTRGVPGLLAPSIVVNSSGLCTGRQAQERSPRPTRALRRRPQHCSCQTRRLQQRGAGVGQLVDEQGSHQQRRGHIALSRSRRKQKRHPMP